MKRLNHKGFTLVEGLLTVIALCLVVGVGFYVFNANSDSAKSNIATSQTKSKSEAKATPKMFLEIKEMGIKIPLTSSISDATYVISPTDDNFAVVSTPKFTAAVDACTSKDQASGSPAALGVVSKYEGRYDNSAPPKDFYAEFVKQLPGFYLEYGHADGGLCSGTDNVKNQAAKDIFDKLDPQLKAAVKQAEAI